MTAAEAYGRPGGGETRIDRVLDGYERLDGSYDEAVDAEGALRPAWRRFFTHYLDLSAGELDRRYAGADRHMRDTGVSYRAYGETMERPWPLNRVPLLIDRTEWEGIAEGVRERAALMERVLADLHGPHRFVSDGSIPATVVTGSPDFLHPLQGVAPAGGQYLSIYAVDLGRGPDGRWQVLGDRTQAPSGAGYSLENRLALSRAFNELYGAMNVERLAPFFQAWRSGLAAKAERVDPRICIWTPGPLAETYFEHAYLARYLGFLLVEGGDLVMRDGLIHIRTTAGLKRADVLLRRIDADFADPLELNGGSRLGVAGLLEAVRGGKVALANALGSGMVEGRALLSRLPALGERLLGRPLQLPSLATHWGGTAEGREAIRSAFDTLMISGAHRERLADAGLDAATLGSRLTAEGRTAVERRLAARGMDIVGQAVPQLSTMPAWDGHRFVPRPFVLRVFAASTPDGWTVMPGGFCRISNSRDASTIIMGAGVQSADVWILSDAPVAASTLLPSRDTVRIRRLVGNLPSRAADNLYWLGRYLERAEAVLRIVRCCCGRRLNTGDTVETSRESGAVALLLDLLGTLDATPQDKRGLIATLGFALHDAGRFGTALRLAREVQRTASIIRERLSADTTRLIDGLVAQLGAPPTRLSDESELFDQADQGLRTIAAISGLSQENMNQVAGWRFLEIGRRIERAVGTCRIVRQFAGEPGPAARLDILLDLIDSQITYRSRYIVGLALAPVRDMAMLDPYNPRSVAFQVAKLHDHIATLPVLRNDGIPEMPNRLVQALAARIATADAATLDGAAIRQIEGDLLALGGTIADRYFLQGASAARAEKFGQLA